MNNNEGIYTAVLIDTRISDTYELVLDNFFNNLDKRWNFMIFCSNNNKDFLINLINTKFEIDKYRTTIIALDINKPISIDINNKGFVDYDYNKLMTSEKFYQLIPTENILLFQLDTLLSNKYSNNIYNFLEYDYVGAPWEWAEYGGNGGLSLRKKSKMLEIINDKSYKCNLPNAFYHEDGYFTEYSNINMPHRDIAKQFCVESIFYDKPVGIHKAFCVFHHTSNEYKELETLFPRFKELHMKWCYLWTTTEFINEPKLDGSYKIDFFSKYQIITFN